jgi:flagellar biosynthesis protein FliR
MDVASLFEPVIKTLMILFRVGPFWIFFPFVLTMTIPATVRMASALALSLALLPVVGKYLPVWSLAKPPTFAEIITFGAKEVFVGIFLAIVGKWIFSAVIAAAQWVGTQMGFSAGALMNPDFEDADTSWAQFHGWLGLMIYFAMGGHFMTLSALIDSYQFDFSNSLSRMSEGTAALEFWSELGKAFFVWMLKLSGPLVVVTLILQAAMGVLSKFIPQINIWTVSIPVTLAVGVLVFMLIAPNYAEVLSALMTEARQSQQNFLNFMGTR